MSTHECKHLNLSTAVSICMKLDVHYASDDSQSRNSSIHWRQQTISIQTWNGMASSTAHPLLQHKQYIYIYISPNTHLYTLLKHTILVISPVCGKLFIQIVYMHLTIIMAISMSISASNSMAKDININI